MRNSVLKREPNQIPGLLTVGQQVTLEPWAFGMSSEHCRRAWDLFHYDLGKAEVLVVTTMLTAIRQQVTCRRQQRRTRGRVWKIKSKEGKATCLPENSTNTVSTDTETRTRPPPPNDRSPLLPSPRAHASRSRLSSQSTRTRQHAGRAPKAQLTFQSQFQGIGSRISKTTTTRS